MTLAIRRMNADDLEPLARVVNAAYKRSTTSAEDLNRYLLLEPMGWFMAEWNGVPAGMVGAVDYGSRAWLGLMGVDPFSTRAGNCPRPDGGRAGVAGSTLPNRRA